MSSRRKRESYGNLIEYQEFEELSLRKKREEAAAAVVETEEEIALRSYESRLRCFPSIFFVALRVSLSVFSSINPFLHPDMSAGLLEDSLMTLNNSTTSIGGQLTTNL